MALWLMKYSTVQMEDISDGGALFVEKLLTQ